MKKVPFLEAKVTVSELKVGREVCRGFRSGKIDCDHYPARYRKQTKRTDILQTDIILEGTHFCLFDEK